MHVYQMPADTNESQRMVLGSLDLKSQVVVKLYPVGAGDQIWILSLDPLLEQKMPVITEPYL